MARQARLEPDDPARRRLLQGRRQYARGGTTPAAARTGTTAAPPPAPVRWLSRATWGFTRTDLVHFTGLGPNNDSRWAAWVNQQLAPASIDDSACDARLAAAGYQTLNKSLPQLWADHHEGDPEWWSRMLPLYETEAATVLRAIYSKRQLFERMVCFWHDHFSVYGNTGSIGPVMPSYDRDVIRAHALGNFRTLLEEVGKSTAMLYYLDNVDSQGANFNENYARELMELHTLGAENYFGPADINTVPCLTSFEIICQGSMPAGYVDNDVYEVARCLTGWTVKNGHWQFPAENDGTFVFRPSWHDTANKIVLGLYMPANQPGMTDGQMVYDRLCQHPGTAGRIAGKLCRRFVGDNASQALIDSVAAVFTSQWQAPDQISQMLQVILHSNEFKQGWGGAMKRPLEATCGALRALNANFTPRPDNTTAWTTSESFFSRLANTGHRPFRWGPPNGYPDDMASWSSSGTLGMTLNLLAWLPEMEVDQNASNSSLVADVVAQTMSLWPDPADRTASNIINAWSDRILGYRPAEVVGPVIAFLQQNAAANEALDISLNDWDLNDLKQHYTQMRLRTAVGMLLMNPAFLRR